VGEGPDKVAGSPANVTLKDIDGPIELKSDSVIPVFEIAPLLYVSVLGYSSYDPARA